MVEQRPAATLTLRLLPETDIEDAEQLLAAMVPQHLAAGEVVIEEGGQSNGLWFVRSGSLTVEVASGRGPVQVATVEEGHWVGEVALLDPGVASATVRAAEPTELLHLTPAALEQVRMDAPDVALDMLRTLSLDLVDRIRTSNELLLERLGVPREADDGPDLGWFGDALSRLFGNRGGRA